MNHNIISAVFDSRSDAEAAVQELRSAGVDIDRLSLVGRHADRTTVTDGSGDVTDEDAGKDAAKGALGGGALGAILGVAALAIPGVGPLAAAGAIASSAIPGAAACCRRRPLSRRSLPAHADVRFRRRSTRHTRLPASHSYYRMRR